MKHKSLSKLGFYLLFALMVVDLFVAIFSRSLLAHEVGLIVLGVLFFVLTGIFVTPQLRKKEKVRVEVDKRALSLIVVNAGFFFLLTAELITMWGVQQM